MQAGRKGKREGRKRRGSHREGGKERRTSGRKKGREERVEDYIGRKEGKG